MIENIFFVICVLPTKTVTKGNEYNISAEYDDHYIIMNDYGNKISLLKSRFGELQVREKEMIKKNVVKCINSGAFKSITINKFYEVVKTTKNFIFIKNNLDKTMRYGKKYFQEVVKPKPAVKPKPIIKENIVVCVYPMQNELTFKKEYEYEWSVDKKTYELVNDLGVKSNYLPKRFKEKA